MSKRICKNCRHWSRRLPDFNICYGVKVGKDVRTSSKYIQTSMDFGCNKFKEIKDDSQNNTVPADSISD